MCKHFIAVKRCVCLLLASTLAAGCTGSVKKTEDQTIESRTEENQTGQVGQEEQASVYTLPVTGYEVDPATFSLTIQEDGKAVSASRPGQSRRVENFKEEGAEKSWEYPEDKISVVLKQEADYLRVTIRSQSEEDNAFTWPDVVGDTYYMPLGEGKRIPADDAAWGTYLRDNDFNVLEQLSMPFFAAAQGDRQVLYIAENPYRSSLSFAGGEKVGFTLSHSYPEIDPEKESSFRIYLTENNPVSAAKVYRSFVKEKGKFVTLKQKEEKNPNVRKMYGAPHIYLWGDNLIGPDDINWPAFRTSLDSGVMKSFTRYFGIAESGKEAEAAFSAIRSQDYVDQYQKNLICRFLSEVLKREDFYDSQIFHSQDENVTLLLEKGMENLNHSGLIKLNKYALAESLPEVFHPAGEWMNRETVELVKDWKAAGIEHAWIGLNSWEQAYAKPELVEEAFAGDYLIGPYDSYHSIHEPGNEKWITAAFKEEALYDNATVTDESGEKVSGFQNVGRKLNPTLSLPSVKERTEEIMAEDLPFNSWFIDCDATGEIYDDYSPEHRTTMQQDLSARMERMAYIRDHFNFVIGSEGGNDFAASEIVFAHGLELPSFAWRDKDMKANKDSPYYIGKYYSATGGVAEHFAKQIPVKEEYYTIFANPVYDLPLYKLVYNDSVITGYHWDWSTFKISGAVQERMLREVLYNVPPLYHLDRAEWETYKDEIISHTKVWSAFSREAITKEMTDFKVLKEDGSVQRTEYGPDLAVTANFGEAAYQDGNNEIPSGSLVIEKQGERTIYTPEVSEEHR